MVDRIQYLRVPRDLRVIPVAAVHIGQVVGEGRDIRGKPRPGIAFQNSAEQVEQRDLGFQRLPVVHMKGQHGKLHKLIARLCDARQVYENSIHMPGVFLKAAGEVIVPCIQDMKHRCFAGGAFRERTGKKAVQEIRVIGHAVFVAPEQKEEQKIVRPFIVAAHQPEAQRTGVVLMVFVILCGGLIQRFHVLTGRRKLFL